MWGVCGQVDEHAPQGVGDGGTVHAICKPALYPCLLNSLSVDQREETIYVSTRGDASPIANILHPGDERKCDGREFLSSVATL